MLQRLISSKLVPILSTPAGSTLTFKNWHQAGIKAYSYRLNDLLMKPGLALLNDCAGLNAYIGCSDPIFLNVEHNFSAKNGLYTLKNRFDGEKVTFSVEELVLLINKINPIGVFLPQDCELFPTVWNKIDKEINVYYPSFINEPIAFRYFYYDGQQDFNRFLTLVQHEKKSVTILGNFDIHQLMALAPYCAMIESDTPAQQGYAGFFFLNDQSLSILDESWIHDHHPLNPSCLCLTCTQKLTRAYLHHLYQKTPLLAQRYLIAHNVYNYQKHLENSSFTST